MGPNGVAEDTLRTCAWCGVEFAPVRWNQRFHDSRERQKAFALTPKRKISNARYEATTGRHRLRDHRLRQMRAANLERLAALEREEQEAYERLRDLRA